MNPIKLVKKTSLIVLSLLLFHGLGAQPNYTARSMGMGGASHAIDGPESVFTNPVSVFDNASSSYIATSTMPFSIPGFIFSGVGHFRHLNDVQWIFGSITNQGIKEYRKTKLSAGYGRRLFESLGIAVEMSFASEHFEGYGNTVGFNYGIFLRQSVASTLTLAVTLRDIVPIPGKFHARPYAALGAAFQANEKLSLYADISQSQESQWRFKSGLEYTPSDILTIRTGVATRPSTFHFGASMVCTSRTKLALAISYHLILGISPSIDITFVP